ncbi:MAG: STAS/SEC14 domain-containing protein, partial [Planctomycetota bacterium]|nr:STAS/SEC14 domain-containing protein [Planctomycetota bacterium]
RCYCELTDFHGITPHALWDELKFDTKHCRDIERCAIVGDPSWHNWMTKISQTIFSRADVKFFDESQSQEAWDWVNEGVESSDTPKQEATATTA